MRWTGERASVRCRAVPCKGERPGRKGAPQPSICYAAVMTDQPDRKARRELRLVLIGFAGAIIGALIYLVTK